jgi:FkbM family methyltransferase
MSQILKDRADAETRWTEVRRQGLLWRLDLDKYLDREIYEHGCFETRTSDIVRQWIRPGMKILDVGANFGYFTTVFAELVGPSGHVWAVEPTRNYGERIRWHLDANGFTERATILNFGLSDSEQECSIDIVDSSASIHLPQNVEVAARETISLRRLDDVAKEIKLPGVDFIKIDIDGHEPFFIKGAQAYLRRYKPALMMEFAWQYLKAAGTNIWELRSQVKELGYELYSEVTLRRIENDEQFSQEVDEGNPSSANIWAFPTGTGPEYLPTPAAERICQAIRDLNTALGRRVEVWLFGAGQHTGKAMVAQSSWSSFGRVSAIVDDDPRFAANQTYLGFPVFNRRQAEAKLEAGTKVDAIILSTDTHQERFIQLTEGLRMRNLDVVKLYPS